MKNCHNTSILSCHNSLNRQICIDKLVVFFLVFPTFVIYFHFLMYAPPPLVETRLLPCFCFLTPQLRYFIFTLRFLYTYNATDPDLIVFLTVLGKQFYRSLIHFFSLMSHIILVYNHVTLCDWLLILQ